MNICDLAEDYLVDPKEGMRKLTASLLNEAMQLEAEKQIQARPYERTGKRKAHRNGTRPRSLKTIHGEIELQKPQIREFSFRTKVFERYSRVEESVRVAVAESYLEGVSTRKVKKVLSKFGLENISASEVSRIAKRLDKQVKEFLNRPIEGSIPFLFVDASYFKVRTNSRYINKELLAVTGIREDGYREILNATVADSEEEYCWESCFEDLKTRGLNGVKLVISDGHKGIQAAVEKVFIGSSWQMCNVHFMRAVLKNISKKDKKNVAYMLKDAIEDERKMQEVAVILDGMGYKKSADTIDRFRFDLWNYKSFPRSYWRKIRTTNGLERINKELKRRSRASGAYSNDQSLLRVAVCIMMDIHEDWITGNKYLSSDE
jgi:transposase-like protein